MRTCAMILTVAAGVTVAAQPGYGANLLENFTIKGKSYFEYVQPMSDEGPATADDFSKFHFTRSYVTIQHNIDGQFQVRFRTDVDRKADDKLRPFVKHAYVAWGDFIGGAKLYAGIYETPTFSLEQKFWGYRGVSKTIMDGFKSTAGKSIGVSSAATGLSLKGDVGALDYHAMVSNGGGSGKPESNDEKRLLLHVSAEPADGITVGAGFETEPVEDVDGSENLMSALVAYENDDMTVGGSWFTQTDAGAEDASSGISVFGRYDLRDDITGFGRYDMNEPNDGIDDDESTVIILGMDYRPIPKVHVMPNVRMQRYSADGVEGDTWAALTFQYQF